VDNDKAEFEIEEVDDNDDDDDDDDDDGGDDDDDDEYELSYDEYQQACEKIIDENEKYLDMFESALIEKGLSKKTVNNHVGNVDFYINTFLLRDEPTPMKEGCFMVDSFLGEFFIRKCMWSTPESIKSTAASLKKFYSCMADNEMVDKVDYDYFCETIKDNIKDWQETCRQFNDPAQENPFAWF